MQKHPLIGMVIATMLEAKPFVTEIPLAKIEQTPFRIFHDKNMYLIISGIGKANAAMATFHLINTLSPDVIINVGAAGAAGKAFKLGEFFHISQIVEYDRPDFRKGGLFSYQPFVLNGFKTARTATQDRPVLEPEKRQEISEVADLVEMESASVIQAASKFKTPCIFFKYVTDTADHTEDKDIVTHIKTYRDSFYRYFMKTVLPEINDTFKKPSQKKDSDR